MLVHPGQSDVIVELGILRQGSFEQLMARFIFVLNARYELVSHSFVAL